MSDLPPFPTLRTARLELREITPDDAPAMLEIHGDAELMRWFGADPVTDLAAAENLIRLFDGWRRHANPGTRWGIQRKGESRLLGSCGLFSWNRNWRKCATGYELRGDVHGQGYMREALTAVVEWGFLTLELNRVEAQIHPKNHASIKLAKKLGFVEEGRLRQVGYWGGQHHDLLQMSLLRDEWSSV